MNKWTVLGFLGVISSSFIPLSMLAGAPGDHRVAARYGCKEVCATKCDQTWNSRGSVLASVEECYKIWGPRNSEMGGRWWWAPGLSCKGAWTVRPPTLWSYICLSGHNSG